MQRITTATTFAILLIGLTGSSLAAKTPQTPELVPTTGNIMVGNHAHKVLIVVNVTTLAAWTYDPSTRAVNSVTVPATVQLTKPIAGAAIVVRHSCPPTPCRPSFKMALNGKGSAAFPSRMQLGIYDVTIAIPANAISTKAGVAIKGISVTIHPVVGRSGIWINKNATPVVASQSG
ncbi:MAG: hypothetical protein WB615_12190 [Candidatus Tumulicola sp.]